MGSFANSLHVRLDDTEVVVLAIRTILEKRGYQSSNEPLSAGGDEPDPGVRALRVAEARDGWVGILDSDLMGLLTLAQELSLRLQTHAICVMVNDSSSWHYELFHKGREVDGFDSPGGSPLLDLDELPGEMLEMPDADELAEAMETVAREMPALGELLQSLLPPEMREIHEKIANGTATAEEAEAFSKWSRELADGVALEFEDSGKKAESELPEAATDSGGNGQAASKKELEGHLHYLRPLLAGGVEPDRLKEILVEKTPLAEEPLADFLEMLGVSRFFARLSFQYFLQYTADEIRSEGLGFLEPLVFVRES